MTNREKRKAHLKTIGTHRKYVRRLCFKMGIPLQGLVHDLSKYSKKEFSVYKYYNDGTRSPHAEMRDAVGYSNSWFEHYHKNKHHWEYYLDIVDWPTRVVAAKMPYKYVIEMFCDMCGAGMAYSKDKWTASSPWEYWQKACDGKRLMHKDSEALIKKLIWHLQFCGSLENFFDWYGHFKKYLKSMYNQGALTFYEDQKK